MNDVKEIVTFFLFMALIIAVMSDVNEIVKFFLFTALIIAVLPLVFICGALLGGCGAVEKTFALWWRTSMYHMGMYDDVE